MLRIKDMFKDKIPKYDELLWPTLVAIKAMDGSGSNEDIYDKIIELYEIPEELQSIVNNRGMSKIAYNIRWAQTYLQKMDVIVNSDRGIWAITKISSNVDEQYLLKKNKEIRKEYNQQRKKLKEEQQKVAIKPSKTQLNIRDEIDGDL
jgi:restriction system protein